MDFAAVLGALRGALGERTLMTVQVVVMVAEHADGIDQLDLSHQAAVPPNTLTKMLRELRDDGLIESSVHDGDRRRRVVRPTPLLMEKWNGVIRLGASVRKRARDTDEHAVVETAGKD